MIQSCPCCGSDNNRLEISAPETHGRHFLSRTKTHPYRLCLNCRTWFIESDHSAETFNLGHYGRNYYGASKMTFVHHWIGFYSKIRKAKTYARIRRSVVAFRPGPIRLLDFGCGGGGFIFKAPTDFEACGAEVNPDGLDRCREHNLHVIERDLNVVTDWPQTVDVVTLWHVLEHIDHPANAIQNAARALRPGGVLFLTVPNVESLGCRWGRDTWFHLDAPRHRFLPSEQGIRCLLLQNGFDLETVFRDTWAFPLDLFWSVRASPWRIPVLLLYPWMKWISRDSIGFIARRRDKPSATGKLPAQQRPDR